MTANTTPDAEMPDELLPCPFCGEQPQTKEWLERGKDALRIYCDDCSVRCHVQSTKDNAIATWNTRTPSPSVERMLPELPSGWKIISIEMRNGEYICMLGWFGELRSGPVRCGGKGSDISAAILAALKRIGGAG